MALDSKHGVNFNRREWMAAALALATTVDLNAAEGAVPATALDHTNVHVPDVERSAAFYTKLFGRVVSRAPNAPAKPGSARGVIWFVRLGENFLAISGAAPGEKPGIDHFCFALAGFDGKAMKPRLAGLNEPWPDLPPANLWVKDPDGNVIQLTPGDRGPVPGAGVGAVLVETPDGAKREPALQAKGLTLLALPVANRKASESYYRKLLGDAAYNTKRKTFRIGQSEIALSPVSAGLQLRIAVIGFDAATASEKLRNLGINAKQGPDRNSVSFPDPDGIRVVIGS